jgi:hypothetical protein
VVCQGNAEAADQSFSLLTWRILTLHSCVGAAVNGFGDYREYRSCGPRRHCGVSWVSWRFDFGRAAVFGGGGATSHRRVSMLAGARMHFNRVEQRSCNGCTRRMVAEKQL